MLNPFNKPATMTNKPLPHADNPLEGLPPREKLSDAFMDEMDAILRVFRACDQGEYQGPWGICSRWYFVICCESAAQRDNLRTAMHLTAHGLQYWTGEAFTGTLDWLKTAQNGPRFEKRVNPFAKATSASKEAPESKYSHLRAEMLCCI